MEERQYPIAEQKEFSVEKMAMSIGDLISQVKLIQEVMSKIMVEDEHYGVIPGTKKPTLLKPGAEKLCLTFRLDPDYQIIREVRDKDFIAYTVKCNLTHIPTGQNIASGIGSCNSRESKYRYRFIEESTGIPVPGKYWDAKKKGDNKEMKRLLQIPNFNIENLRAAKIDGQWVIAKSEKIENDNPWDLDNTLIKMGCKRSLVAAILNATAASDIFTQDTEDMPSDIINGEIVKDKPPKSTGRGQTSTTMKDNEKGEDTSSPKMDKLTKAFVTAIEEWKKDIGETNVMECLGTYGVTTPEEILVEDRGKVFAELAKFKKRMDNQKDTAKD